MRSVQPTQLVLIALWFALGCRPDAEILDTAGGRFPNVLFLITDQHHHQALGLAGDGRTKTPNLDRLAREGARFTRATTVSPVCSPARASFVTGQWPHTHGVVRNIKASDNLRITDKHVTLDDLLFDRGFKLRHFGKWHIGDRTHLRSYRAQGNNSAEKAAYERWRSELDESVIGHDARPGETFTDGVFMTEAVAKAHAVWKEDPYRSRQDLSVIGRSPVAPRATFENWLADEAIGWIEAHAEQPFMLTYSVSPPHAQWVAPEPYYSMYDPKEVKLPASFTERPGAYRTSQPARMVKLLGEQAVREYLRCYYAQVTQMDHQFGRILDTLRDLGLEEDTLVIFTSDHGDMQGGHGMMGKGVVAFFDEVLRVPLIVRYPPSISPGLVVDMHASSVDLMPTVLDYLGISIPQSVQGRSLRPVLDGKKKPDERPTFSERGNSNRMIRTKNWKLAIFENGRRELFNLAEDPDEIHDLANEAAYRSQRKELEAELRAWMRQTGDPALEAIF